MAKKPKAVVAIGLEAPEDDLGGPMPDETDIDAEAPLEEEASLPPEPEEEEYAEGSYPEFTVPEGLDLSDLAPGEEKEVLCTVRLKEGGTACITQVDGVDLAGEATGEMEGPPPAAPPPPPPPMAAPGGPPPGPPGANIRGRAAAMGLM